MTALRFLVRGLSVLVLALGLSACGSGSSGNQYERAAARLVEGFGKKITVRSVNCSHIHDRTAACTLTDTTGTSYSCEIALQRPIYTNAGCFWSRAGGGGPP